MTAKQRVRKTHDVLYLCGGDMRPGLRDTSCPNQVHDYPLPIGYVDASEVAVRRLRHGWSNRKCPECGLYGWLPGRPLRGDE